MRIEVYDAKSNSFINAGRPAVSPPPTDAPEEGAERRPPFPEAGWRGVFGEYRRAMQEATEASDVFHFATLWVRAVVALGRRVYFPYGLRLFPNAYIVCFGPTGDRKTTATRMVETIGQLARVIRGGGSGEGVADEFSLARPGEGLLLFAEEFSSILRPGRWDGATLIPFLTACFDCPPRFEQKFRKSPVNLDQPTPSLLAGATPDWFWRDFRVGDFEGGFGNRLFFLTGERKAPIPRPQTPDLARISEAVDALADVRPCEAHLSRQAEALWDDFYLAWDSERECRQRLLLAAVQRIPAYALKLAMVYAALERSLPEITFDQLAAAILVGRYGETCAAELISLQSAGANPTKELEQRILAFVQRQGGQTTKRSIYKAVWRHYSTTETFNRAFDSLVRAGCIFTKSGLRGSVQVSMEPLEGL